MPQLTKDILQMQKVGRKRTQRKNLGKNENLSASIPVQTVKLDDTLEGINQKFIIIGKTVYTLHMVDGVWYDAWGTIWGLTDEQASMDAVDRCGIGDFSFPDGHPLNDMCLFHDNAYSTPVYQLYHTRLEADQMLLHQIQEYGGGWSFLGKPFYYIARIIGRFFWENKKTK